MAKENNPSALEVVKIKVRILISGKYWFGEMDTVEAEKKDTDPPIYQIKQSRDLDDELEFKGGDQVYCADDKKRGLVAAWLVRE